MRFYGDEGNVQSQDKGSSNTNAHAMLTSNARSDAIHHFQVGNLSSMLHVVIVRAMFFHFSLTFRQASLVDSTFHLRPNLQT